jgi:hypothetical protein
MILGHILFVPLLPLTLLGLIAALAAIGTIIALARGARGSLWRGLAFLLLLTILAGPHWTAETTSPLPDIALVLVDHSQSMDIGTRTVAAAAARASLAASAGATDLRIIDIPPADDDGTSLFAALQAAVASVPLAQLAGIIAITDGEISDPPATAQLPAPFSTLLTAQAPETDRELRLLDAPAYGLVGKTVTLKFTVLDHGADDFGTRAGVTISVNGTTIATPQVMIGQPTYVEIPITHAGPATIAAVVAKLPGEISQINNQTAFTLNGIHKRLNILLISGSPNQGERSWRLLLKSDPAVQLVHFTILRTPGETIDADPKDLALVPFPVHQLFETDIGKFDLIIMDRFNAAGLLPASYLGNIADYVQNGGALLTEVGPEFASPDSLAFSPLSVILPAAPTDPGTITQQFTPEITALGARHPVTAPLAGLTLPSWYRMEAATPASGDVLMTGAGNAPLLILGDAGKGRVGMLLSDQLWLWTRGGQHEGPALPLLRRIVHWLLREPALEAENLTASIRGGQLVVDRQTIMPGNPGPAAITTPDGKTSSLSLVQTAPGHFSGSMPAPAQSFGVWKIAQGKLTAYAASNAANVMEYQDLAATDEILKPYSRNLIWLGKDPHPTLSPLLTPRHAAQVTGTRDIPLLPPLPALLAVLTVLFLAWWRENR